MLLGHTDTRHDNCIQMTNSIDTETVCNSNRRVFRTGDTKTNKGDAITGSWVDHFTDIHVIQDTGYYSVISEKTALVS